MIFSFFIGKETGQRRGRDVRGRRARARDEKAQSIGEGVGSSHRKKRSNQEAVAGRAPPEGGGRPSRASFM